MVVTLIYIVLIFDDDYILLFCILIIILDETNRYDKNSPEHRRFCWSLSYLKSMIVKIKFQIKVVVLIILKLLEI